MTRRAQALEAQIHRYHAETDVSPERERLDTELGLMDLATRRRAAERELQNATEKNRRARQSRPALAVGREIDFKKLADATKLEGWILAPTKDQNLAEWLAQVLETAPRGDGSSPQDRYLMTAILNKLKSAGRGSDAEEISSLSQNGMINWEELIQVIEKATPEGFDNYEDV